MEKVGLQISFGKTEYMTSYKPTPTFLETKYGKVERVSQFKYLGEVIKETGLERMANEIRCQKMKTAFWLTRDICNKTKLRHYNTVIKPECLYGAETLILNRKKDMDEIKKEVIRKSLGPKLTDEGTYRLRANNEILNYTDRYFDIKKLRLKFYGHIKRIEPTRLTKRVVGFYENRRKAKIETIKWISAVKKDLKDFWNNTRRNV